MCMKPHKELLISFGIAHIPKHTWCPKIPPSLLDPGAHPRHFDIPDIPSFRIKKLFHCQPWQE